MTTKPADQLTLRDRLSWLELREAEQMLGRQGAELIRKSSGYEIDVEKDTDLTNEYFRVQVDDAVVDIRLAPEHKRRLRIECSQCNGACPHKGAALSLVLEEKMTLGLSDMPTEKLPLEMLSPEELVERAVKERADRASQEKMRITPAESETLWTDYTVYNPTSGNSYRVALRGWERGDSYCSCPDFRKNRLGTCKHLIKVQRSVKQRFPAHQRNQPYVRTGIRVAVDYTEQPSLRLLLPEKLPPNIRKRTNKAEKLLDTDIEAFIKTLRALQTEGQDVVVYPDAEEMIQRQLHQRHIKTTVEDIRQDPANHPLRTDLVNAELHPYQLDGIAFAAGAGRAVLADDMGLGKTIQGIGLAEFLRRETGISKVLVICPASLKSQWRNEINRFTGLTTEVVLGGASERAQQYATDAFFTICNYEQVLRDLASIEPVDWDLIILDEGQRIKNWETKTSQVIRSLSSPFALVLTGTPLENRLEELYTVVQFIDEQRLGPAFRFLHEHRIVNDKGRVLGYRNLDQLREKLKPIMLRRTRQAVNQELPPRTTEIVRIEPTEEQLTLHSGHSNVVSQIVHKKYLTEMDLMRLQKALLMCRLCANASILADKQEPNYSSKLQRLGELLEEIRDNGQRKVVLFSEWTSMLDLIEPQLQSLDLNYVRLDGSVPQKKRASLMHTFNNDDRYPFFISTNAGATGLNLQSADTVINVDLPWNPAVLEQRISRVHRMGQSKPVQVYLMVTEQTMEENLLNTLSTKHQVALAALDSESELEEVSMESGMEELKRRLEVLLGAREEAPADQSAAAETERETKELTDRKKRISTAAGQMVGAAFNMLAEMAPEQDDTTATQEMAEKFRERFAECLEQTEDGQLQMTVTLQDAGALDSLSKAMASFMNASGQS